MARPELDMGHKSNPVPCDGRQRDDLVAPVIKKWISGNGQCLNVLLISVASARSTSVSLLAFTT